MRRLEFRWRRAGGQFICEAVDVAPGGQVCIGGAHYGDTLSDALRRCALKVLSDWRVPPAVVCAAQIVSGI